MLVDCRNQVTQRAQGVVVLVDRVFALLRTMLRATSVAFKQGEQRLAIVDAPLQV